MSIEANDNQNLENNTFHRAARHLAKHGYLPSDLDEDVQAELEDAGVYQAAEDLKQ